MTETNMLPVIGLKVENVQKIVFAEINPDRNTVIISGNNGAGKSSLCNALKLALGDKVASKLITRPITDGEDHASVTVDLGKFKITRTWNAKGKSVMKIESSDGAIYKTPAEMLKKMVGNLALDPLEFSMMTEKDQVHVLLDLIELPINLDDMAEQREEAYGVRTLINRSVTRLQGQVEGHPHPGNDVPDTELSAADVMSEMQAANEQIALNQNSRTAFNSLKSRIQFVENTITELELQLKANQANLIELETKAAAMSPEIERLVDPDLSQFKTKLSEVEAMNLKVRNKLARDKLLEDIAKEKAKSQEKTDEINAIDKLKADTIKAAVMPIDGLSLDESGVTFNGIPLKQCSSSESLKVCCAIVISKMKKQTGDVVPVIIIKDGSLLDDDNLKVIEQIAIDEGIQFWIELVSTTGDKGIYIEDGMVV